MYGMKWLLALLSSCNKAKEKVHFIQQQHTIFVCLDLLSIVFFVIQIRSNSFVEPLRCLSHSQDLVSLSLSLVDRGKGVPHVVKRYKFLCHQTCRMSSRLHNSPLQAVVKAVSVRQRPS